MIIKLFIFLFFSINTLGHEDNEIRINDISINRNKNIEIDKNKLYDCKKLRNYNNDSNIIIEKEYIEENIEENIVDLLNITEEDKRVLGKDVNEKLIVYNDTNSVSIRSNIGTLSTENFIRNILSLKSDKIYIHLYTNGGSVFDGLRIIEVINGLKSLNIKIICVAHKAISMGFIIYQYCDERYSLETSILMHHDIQIGGFGGSYEEINSYLKFLNKIKLDIKSKIINVLNWNDERYNDVIKSEWWLYGKDILDIGLSTKIVNIYCNFTQKYQNDIYDDVLSGDQIFKIFDKCPLIINPIDK